MTPPVTIEQVTRERDVVAYLFYLRRMIYRRTACRRRVSYSHFIYWGEERRSAWWTKVGGEIAGFALVRLDAGGLP
jgi:hypothetical protein